MKQPRLVFDTNVLLSALLFYQGTLAQPRILWQSGAIVPLASRETVSELIRVLSYPKFQLKNKDREDLLADYLPWCETLKIEIPPKVPHCRDPFDRPFLDLAKTAKADILVTGDKDLVALSDMFSAPILIPREFQDRLS